MGPVPQGAGGSGLVGDPQKQPGGRPAQVEGRDDAGGRAVVPRAGLSDAALVRLFRLCRWHRPVGRLRTTATKRATGELGTTGCVGVLPTSGSAGGGAKWATWDAETSRHDGSPLTLDVRPPWQDGPMAHGLAADNAGGPGFDTGLVSPAGLGAIGDRELRNPDRHTAGPGRQQLAGPPRRASNHNRTSGHFRGGDRNVPGPSACVGRNPGRVFR